MDWNQFTQDIAQFATQVSEYGMWTAIVYFTLRFLEVFAPIFTIVLFSYLAVKVVTNRLQGYLSTFLDRKKEYNDNERAKHENERERLKMEQDHHIKDLKQKQYMEEIRERNRHDEEMQKIKLTETQLNSITPEMVEKKLDQLTKDIFDKVYANTHESNTK